MKDNLDFLKAIVILTALTVILQGCGKLPDANITINEPNTNKASSTDPASSNVSDQVPVIIVVASPTPTPTVTPTPTPTSIPTSVTLQVYSETKLVISVETYRIYGTGSCTTYEGKTYCWDDGIHSLLGTIHATFWGMQNSNLALCFNTCTADLMITPIYMSHDVEVQLSNVKTAYERSVDDVLANGTEKTYNCTDNHGVVTCTSFVIDTNQPSL